MKNMRICTAPGAVDLRMQKNMRRQFVLYDVTIVLLHVNMQICAEKSPVGTGPHILTTRTPTELNNLTSSSIQTTQH
jgi:hypothetical protein